MKKVFNYACYAFMFLGGWFMPLPIYASILLLYWLIDAGVYFFRVRENLKGIYCMLGSVFIILFVYINFILNLLEKSLSHINF